MTRAYYNEIDPYAAQWLRNLIAAGHIAPGDVDERSIVEVRPDEIKGYVQCHFFAGIGVWSHALRSAGWADDRPVWTGSCPCQPFSAAGKGNEFGDERHLWPVWFRLIRECRPVAVFGEQVASKDALAWLDHVSTDLEGEGYTFGAVDTCAAGFGAPHIRQRLYFVADAGCGSVRCGRSKVGSEASGSQGEGDQRQRLRADDRHGGIAGELAYTGRTERRPQPTGGHDDDREESHGAQGTGGAGERGEADGMAHASDSRYRSERNSETGRREPVGDCVVGHAESNGWITRWAESARQQGRHLPAGASGIGVVLGDSGSTGLQGREQRAPRNDHGGGQEAHGSTSESGGSPGPTNGRWADAEWLPCRDGKARPTEPGTFPLAHGATARVGRLRAYGNAINAAQAEEFIRAYQGIQ